MNNGSKGRQSVTEATYGTLMVPERGYGNGVLDSDVGGKDHVEESFNVLNCGGNIWCRILGW